jgi:hypothetical protein
MEERRRLDARIGGSLIVTALPFTFYWANENETTFNAETMNVFDEEVLSFAVKHDEGQIPTLEIIVKNPRVGLLSPGRKVWAWLGWQSPANDPVYAGALVPLFFGVLVGIPTSLFQEKVTLQFIARSPQFIENKQALAETMKNAPFYDPVFIDTAKRDDPDTILEGWSALWHIDRTTLDITYSDILTGEDGNIEFDESVVLYDSVSLQLGQPPLANVRVEATVNWQQRSSGFITVPTVALSSYTGDTLISDWPKAGSAIGGGYTCESSFTTDVYLVGATPQTSYNSSWTNTDPDPGQCSNASEQNSSSGPALLTPNYLSCVLTGYLQSGVCDPYADPPVNTPLHMQSTGLIVPMWSVALDMNLRYDANRGFSEILGFDMTANTQAILTSPLVSQDTELITISSVDLSQPLIEVDAWSDFAGRAVQLAQVIFPNNPTTPGGLSYQICVGPGTAGETEPVFSDVPGETTVDGSVTWSSLGGQQITDAVQWSSGTFVPLGQIMLLTDETFNAEDGDFETVPGSGSYYICTTAGETNGVYTQFQYTPPVTTNLEPTPAVRTIDYIQPPTYETAVGAQVTDGSVVWTVLGPSPALLGLPIGGTINNVTARSYFPTDRGQQSIQYLIAKARARLRFRSRAVTISWEAPFNTVVPLSCRHNATIFDPRLPGGAATGKVTSYSLIGGGDGTIRGKVEIGCAVGFGDSIAEITGTPEYVNTGYVQEGYQVYDGSTVYAGNNDVTYEPPIFETFDDGLQFPLQWADISDGGIQSGTLAEQETAIKASFQAARTLAWLNTVGGSISTSQSPSLVVTGQDPATAWQITREQIALSAQNTPYVMAANPVSWSCVLKPCAGNGPFGGSYEIEVSPLVVPQGINLEAASSP